MTSKILVFMGLSLMYGLVVTTHASPLAATERLKTPECQNFIDNYNKQALDKVTDRSQNNVVYLEQLSKFQKYLRQADQLSVPQARTYCQKLTNDKVWVVTEKEKQALIQKKQQETQKQDQIVNDLFNMGSKLK